MNPAYEAATRPLEAGELDKIHKELDFVHQFTDRYDSLFNEHRFRVSPDLLGEYNHMCTVLTRMERHGVRAAMYCNKRQMDLLTTADVANYISSVAVFSNDRMKKLVRDPRYHGQYTHWDKDNQALHIMERDVKRLLKAISPTDDHRHVDPPGYLRLSYATYMRGCRGERL